MTNTQDFTKAFTEMFDQMPKDFGDFSAAFRNSAELSEKLSKVALTAAEQSAAISNSWTKDTLAKLADATTAKEDPAAYGKAVTDLASRSFETASENVVAFAEVAKRVQMETIELLLATGQNVAPKAGK